MGTTTQVWSGFRLKQVFYYGVFAVSLSLSAAMAGCHSSRTTQPVTLKYFRLGWSQPDELPTAEPLTRRFEQESGLGLKNLPVPETSVEQLKLSRALLATHSSGPDVLGVDIIWLGTLQDDFIDLRPYLMDKLPALSPQLVSYYTIHGKLLAVPYSFQTGVLEYRTDLLRKYGFTSPPRTWDELEMMASRIQKGERSAGKHDFWGYVWQGAPAESLTCNGLEWQAAEGAGEIIENNGTISVDNASTVRAWERARRWIGTISPPGVVSYHESDSANVFDAGNAAFNRVWGGAPITITGQSAQVHWRKTLPESKTGYTSIPGGPGGWAAALGGSGLAVSRYSANPREAIRLVQFLIDAQIKDNETEDKGSHSTPEIDGRPSLPEAMIASATSPETNHGIVSRPSNQAGAAYEQVSRLYIAALHSVLTGERPTKEALSQLEVDLGHFGEFKLAQPHSARMN